MSGWERAPAQHVICVHSAQVVASMTSGSLTRSLKWKRVLHSGSASRQVGRYVEYMYIQCTRKHFYSGLQLYLLSTLTGDMKLNTDAVIGGTVRENGVTLRSLR